MEITRFEKRLEEFSWQGFISGGGNCSFRREALPLQHSNDYSLPCVQMPRSAVSIKSNSTRDGSF